MLQRRRIVGHGAHYTVGLLKFDTPNVGTSVKVGGFTVLESKLLSKCKYLYTIIVPTRTCCM